MLDVDGRDDVDAGVEALLDVRQAVGFVPEDECLFPTVPGVEFVGYAGELCGMSPAEAAALCDQTLSKLAGRNSSSYQAWRELVQKSFSSSLRATWHDDFHGFLEPAASRCH